MPDAATTPTWNPPGAAATLLCGPATQQQTRQRWRIRILPGAVICTVLGAALGAVASLTHTSTTASILQWPRAACAVRSPTRVAVQ